MAKKKVGNASIAMFAAALFGVLAICMLFASALKVSGGGKSGSLGTGFEFVFATQDGLKFNFMMFLPFLLTIVGIAGVVLSFVLKSKLGGFLAVAAFLVAGIFFFLFRATLSISVGDDGYKIIETTEKLGAKYGLGIGAIMAGIFGILASLASAAATFVLKK